MARLSRRFSRYFSLSRLSRSSTSPKIHKSHISKPLVPSDEDTHHLMDPAHTRTHSHASSTYTISDAELHSIEQQRLGRRIENDIDSIIASYHYTPHTATAGLLSDTHTYTSSSPSSLPHPTTSPPQTPPSASPSSTYSSPPPTPPAVMRARLERFRDTPPPAPGWEKVCFARETRLFGPESKVVLGDEGGAGRGKDWRGEFGRRGYAVL